MFMISYLRSRYHVWALLWWARLHEHADSGTMPRVIQKRRVH